MKLLTTTVALVLMAATSFAQSAQDFANTKWAGKDKSYPITMSLEIDADLHWNAEIVQDGKKLSYDGELLEVVPLFGGKVSEQNPLVLVLDKAQDIPALAIVKTGKKMSLVYDSLVLEKK